MNSVLKTHIDYFYYPDFKNTIEAENLIIYQLIIELKKPNAKIDNLAAKSVKQKYAIEPKRFILKRKKEANKIELNKYESCSLIEKKEKDQEQEESLVIDPNYRNINVFNNFFGDFKRIIFFLILTLINEY